MSELRHDPISGRWVIVAPDRALRPNSSVPAPRFSEEAEDPFAEGNEHLTPGELLAYRAPGTQPDTPGWRVRVVPNKFPAVTGIPAEEGMAAVGASTAITTGNKEWIDWERSAVGTGPHEVIIECPQKAGCLSELSRTQVREVLQAYVDRLQFHRRQHTCVAAMVFKNKGMAGGATLAHAHSQLLGTSWVPQALQTELTHCRVHWKGTKRSLFTELLAHEQQVATRLVDTSEHFAVLCPFASRVPCEMLILPRRVSVRFEECSSTELDGLAATLLGSLQRLMRVIPDVAYNYVIHSAPFEATAEGFCWHLEIIPRVGNIAGFEWGGGGYINTVPPEAAAAKLREAGRIP